MYHSWLDSWDERRVERGNRVKVLSPFSLDAQLAFPDLAGRAVSIGDFGDLAERALDDPSYYGLPSAYDLNYRWDAGYLSFASEVSTVVPENNIVRARLSEGGSRDHVLIVFHHWNASRHYNQLAKLLAMQGIAVAQIEMPYHFGRSRPGSSYSDYMLSPSLGRTIQSIRQAVIDGRKLIRLLEGEGYGRISVLGFSLGSWVAGLVAANDPAVSKAALFLTGGSLADMVWEGRATRHIRASLEGHIDPTELNRAWSLLNLENYARHLSRPELQLQIVLAERDTVVPSQVSRSLVSRLNQAGAKHGLLTLNCGHYSFSLPPYILRAGLRSWRFLAE